MLRLIRELATGDRMVVVATHDSRILPLADRVVELVPDFAESNRPPSTVRLEAGEVLFEEGTMGVHLRGVRGRSRDRARIGRGGGAVGRGPATTSAIGPLFHMPRSATASTDAAVIGYTVAAFRERLGVGGIRDLIEHRPLDIGDEPSTQESD